MLKYLENTRYGQLIYVENDQFIGKAITKYGENDWLEWELLSQLVQRGDVVLDVGSHIGTMTLPMARQVGHQGRVYAFEAQPMLFYALCGNLALNNIYNVIPLNAAISDSDHQNVYLPIIDYNSADFNYAGICPMTESSSDCYTIRTLTIDTLNLQRVDLMKIDVESMEPKVLAGASRTIREKKPLLYVESLPGTKEQIIPIIESLGYQWIEHNFPLFNPNNYYGNAENIFRLNEASYVSYNLLCYPPERTEQIRRINAS